MVHDGGQLEAKALMKNNGHHFRAEFHHLQQETQFFTFFCQTLAQYVAAFGVKRQVIYFRLVRGLEFEKK